MKKWGHFTMFGNDYALVRLLSVMSLEDKMMYNNHGHSVVHEVVLRDNVQMMELLFDRSSFVHRGNNNYYNSVRNQKTRDNDETIVQFSVKNGKHNAFAVIIFFVEIENVIAEIEQKIYDNASKSPKDYAKEKGLLGLIHNILEFQQVLYKTEQELPQYLEGKISLSQLTVTLEETFSEVNDYVKNSVIIFLIENPIWNDVTTILLNDSQNDEYLLQKSTVAAVAHGNIQILELLCENGANVAYVDYDNKSLLHVAQSKAKVMRFLLEKKNNYFDVNATYLNGLTLLGHFIQTVCNTYNVCGNEDISKTIKYLLDRGVDMRPVSGMGVFLNNFSTETKTLFTSVISEEGLRIEGFEGGGDENQIVLLDQKIKNQDEIVQDIRRVIMNANIYKFDSGYLLGEEKLNEDVMSVIGSFFPAGDFSNIAANQDVRTLPYDQRQHISFLKQKMSESFEGVFKKMKCDGEEVKEGDVVVTRRFRADLQNAVSKHFPKVEPVIALARAIKEFEPDSRVGPSDFEVVQNSVGHQPGG